MAQQYQQHQQTRPKKKKTATAAAIPLPKGIRQRPSGRFIIDLTINGMRRTATANTLAEAVKQRRRMEEAAATTAASPTPPAAIETPWTLQDAFERTMTSVWSGLASEKTNRINSNTALDFFGSDCLITAVNTDAVDRYVVTLADNYASDATINRKLSALGRILRTAYERGQIDRMPKIPRRKERQGRIRFLSPKEETDILNHLRHLGKFDHHDATVVLLDTGFRTGELWRVTAEHVDLAQGNYGTITLWRTKNNKPRTIPMTHRVREVILRRMREHTESPLFPYDKQWYRHTWDKVRLLLNKDDDPEFVPHCLRHTCCSRLVQRGVPITHVQRWMGHNSLQTTMRYSHLMPHDLFSAVAVLEGGENARWDVPSGSGDDNRCSNRTGNQKRPKKSKRL